MCPHITSKGAPLFVRHWIRKIDKAVKRNREPGPDTLYESNVHRVAESAALVAETLSKAHRTRSESMHAWLNDDRLVGLDELLQGLRSCKEIAKDTPNLMSISRLFERAIADFEMAIEATFSGMNSVVFDAMRDVMEIEYLLADFAAAPENIQDWASANFKTLKSKYGPNTLRQRRARRLGIPVDDLPTATDYRGHSTFLHVNPWINPFGGKGILAGRSSHLREPCFWEMYRHGGDVLATMIELISENSDNDQTPTELYAFLEDGPEASMDTFVRLRGQLLVQERGLLARWMSNPGVEG